MLYFRIHTTWICFRILIFVSQNSQYQQDNILINWLINIDRELTLRHSSENLEFQFSNVYFELLSALISMKNMVVKFETERKQTLIKHSVISFSYTESKVTVIFLPRFFPT